MRQATRPVPPLLVAAALSLSLLAAGRASAIDLCVDGMAGSFPCDRVDLLSQLTPAELGAASASDNWGWTDPLTGVEYAIVCTASGTAFVDLGDPENPVYLGTLPGTVTEGGEGEPFREPLLSPHHGGGENLVHIRDVKVYADHAFAVADLSNNGMQVFDLTQLRDVVNPPVTFGPDFTYTGISDAHNIAINEDTAFAYAVSDDTCAGGLHMIDISDPLLPTFAGCFSDDGSTHDVQCVVYAGPDVEHQGSEICFASNLDTLTIVDVTDKANPVMLSRNGYPGASITHQGWLTEDHAFFLLGDEGDESSFGFNTTTYVWDVSDLDLPVVAHTYAATTSATDHNQYVRGNFNYQGNYKAGLRVQAIDAATGALTEVAFLDTRPGEDDTGFSGAWSTYPFFDSGITIVTDTANGLFVVRANVDSTIFADGFESGDTSAWSAGP